MSSTMASVSGQSVETTGAGPYCGIYALYGAARQLHGDIELERLLNARYVGSQGSSLGQIQLAARDHGLFATPLARLTTGDLRRAKTPVILHVSSVPGSDEFDHLVLFMGMRSGRFAILDPPSTSQLLSTHELLRIWNGTGLYISREPVGIASVRMSGLYDMLTWLVAAAVIATGFFLYEAYSDGDSTQGVGKRIMTQAAVLIASAASAALVLSMWTTEGGYAHTLDSGSVPEEPLAAGTPPPAVIGWNDLDLWIRESSVTVIDVRMPRQYHAGHIPSAINIPVFISDSRRRMLLEHIPPDSRIVLYCENDACGYADSMYSLLMQDGYKTVMIYRAGWEGWQNGNHRVADEPVKYP